MEIPLLTVEEVAVRLAVKPDTVRRWLRRGQLHGILPGGRRLGYRVPTTELERFAPTKSEPWIQQPNPALDNDQAAAIQTALAGLHEELLVTNRQLPTEIAKSLPRTTSLSIQDRSLIVQALQAAEGHAIASRQQLAELQHQVADLTQLVQQLHNTLSTSHRVPPARANAE